MAIRLEKGQRINLEKETGAKLTNFCVGCNWGAIVKKSFFGLMSSNVDVDLDLSCLMFDIDGKPIDHIWSPLYHFGDRKIEGIYNMLPIVTSEGIEGSIIVFGDEIDRSYEICMLLSKLIMLELNIT